MFEKKKKNYQVDFNNITVIVFKCLLYLGLNKSFFLPLWTIPLPVKVLILKTAIQLISGLLKYVAFIYKNVCSSCRWKREGH